MRRWHILAAAGLAGVASLALVPFETILPANALPVPLRLLALIQPALLTMLAIAVGGYCAPRVRLSAPLTEAWAKGEPGGRVLRRQVVPAVLVALLAAGTLLLYDAAVAPRLIALAQGPAKALAQLGLPVVTRLLYGGLTEELLTRWGLMSLVAWVLWRLGVPHPAALGAAIATAALLFAAGHLPLLMLVAPAAPGWMVAAVVAGNAVPGLLFGWLFWRRGLESAMLAHLLAHAVAAALSA